VCCALLTLAGEGHSDYDAKEKKKSVGFKSTAQTITLQYFTLALQSLLELV